MFFNTLKVYWMGGAARVAYATAVQPGCGKCIKRQSGLRVDLMVETVTNMSSVMGGVLTSFIPLLKQIVS